MNNVVVYPIIIKFCPDDTNYPYLVEIPAINGFTQGKSISDSIKMAEDYIGTFSLTNSKMHSLHTNCLLIRKTKL